jgi:hypothetical protein
MALTPFAIFSCLLRWHPSETEEAEDGGDARHHRRYRHHHPRQERHGIRPSLGFGESLMMLILAALLSTVVIICGFFLIYTVYFRFLKIMVIVPLGALAFATVAGNRNLAHSASAYAKNLLAVMLEAVTMALAIMLCNAFINSGLPSFAGGLADWTQTLIYLCEMTFTIALTVGSVKGAQSLTKSALGL